jgi:hypothetical protein
MRGFNRRKIVAACINDFITRLCCNNCLQDIKYISNCAPIASNASSKKHVLLFLIQPRTGCSKYVYHVLCCWFRRNRNTWENPVNSLWHFSFDFFENPVSNCTAYSRIKEIYVQVTRRGKIKQACVTKPSKDPTHPLGAHKEWQYVSEAAAIKLDACVCRVPSNILHVWSWRAPAITMEFAGSSLLRDSVTCRVVWVAQPQPSVPWEPTNRRRQRLESLLWDSAAAMNQSFV